MTSKTQNGGECKTKGCEHYTPVAGEVCRYCVGRYNFKRVNALRAALRLLGAKIKYASFFGPVVKKKVAKVEPISVQLVKRVKVEQIKPGALLAPNHGEVISVKPHQARKLVGKKHASGGKHGILFTTTVHARGVWFPLGTKVWTVTGTTQIS